MLRLSHLRRTLLLLLGAGAFTLAPAAMAEIEITGLPALGELTQTQVAQWLHRGVTTQAEVEGRLGAPQQAYPQCMGPDLPPRAADSAWTFCWARYKYRWWSSVRHDHIKKLQITFDHKHVVHDFSFEDRTSETDDSGSGQFISLNLTFFGFPRPKTAASHEPNTPLTRAVRDNALDQVVELLKRGASPNEANYDGETPLSIAARSGNVGLVKLLLDHGASFKPVQRASGGIPYQYVARQQNALHVAAFRDQVKIVRLFLAHGADVNEYDGSTMLLEAVKGDKADTAALLLASGADPNLYAHGGNPPLMEAVRNRNVPLIKRLLDAGARPDARNHTTGQTSISFARTLGALEIEALLKAHPSRPKGAR